MNCLASVALSVVVSALAPAVVRADVLVVDAGGGGQFTQIQPAIDAATDGDTILVETGIYKRFSVNNKSLSILGDVGATVHIDGMIDIGNLDVDKVFHLQNLSSMVAQPFVPTIQFGINLHGNLGRVRLQNCQFTGYSAANCTLADNNGFDGCRSRVNADLALIGCTARGGRGSTDGNGNFGSGGIGLSASHSYLTLYETNCLGGNGGQCIDGAWGGVGLEINLDAFMFGSSGSVFGGSGADSVHAFCSYGGDGGTGLSLFGGSRVVALGLPIVGGFAGHGNTTPGCVDTDGSPGAPTFVAGDSNLIQLSGQARTLACTSPASASSSETLTLHGLANDHVTLYSSDAPDWQYVPDWKGVLLLNVTPHHSSTMDLGSIPANGTLSVQLPIADPGVPAKVLYLQPLFTDAQNNKILGTPRSIVVLQ